MNTINKDYNGYYIYPIIKKQMGKAIKSPNRKGNRILKQLASIYVRRDNDKYKSIKAVDRAYHRAEELERQFGMLNLPKAKKK